MIIFAQNHDNYGFFIAFGKFGGNIPIPLWSKATNVARLVICAALR